MTSKYKSFPEWSTYLLRLIDLYPKITKSKKKNAYMCYKHL